MGSVLSLLPAALAIGVGLGFGLLKGGRLDNLLQWRPASLEVAAAAVFALVLAELLPTSGLVVFLLELIGLFGTLYAAWMNRRVGGMVMLAVGVFLNMAVLMVNGETPVSPSAIVSAGLAKPNELSRVQFSGPRGLADDATLLGFLGDNINLPFGLIVSPGDIATWIGLGLCTQSIIRRRQVRSARELASRRAAPNNPTSYRDAMDVLGMGPADNPGQALAPPGTGHPQSGMVRRLPKVTGPTEPAADGPRAVLPPSWSAADAAEDVVRILPGPPGEATEGESSPADDTSDPEAGPAATPAALPDPDAIDSMLERPIPRYRPPDPLTELNPAISPFGAEPETGEVVLTDATGDLPDPTTLRGPIEPLAPSTGENVRLLPPVHAPEPTPTPPPPDRVAPVPPVERKPVPERSPAVADELPLDAPTDQTPVITVASPKDDSHDASPTD